MTIHANGETATIEEYRAARDNANGMLDHLQTTERPAFIARVFKALSPEDRQTVITENQIRNANARRADLGRLD